MNYGRAFLAGVVGGAVMSILMAIARNFMGMPANLEMMEGTMLGLQPSMTTWIIGLMMHLVISGLIGIIYAVGFEYVAHRAGWLTGVGFSIVHILIGGVAMGMVPLIHPFIPEMMPAPGAFLSNLGATGVIAFIMLHMIYGAIVGAMYPPVHSRVNQTAAV